MKRKTKRNNKQKQFLLKLGQGDHLFSSTSTPVGTFYTLTEIYNKIPTIDATKVLLGTSYLGIAGTYDTLNLTDSCVQS